MSDDAALVPAPPTEPSPYDFPKATQEQIDAYLATRKPAKVGRQYCKAHTNQGPRRGLPCALYAIRGGTVCPYHGGRAKQVKAAAERKLREMVPLAHDAIEQCLTQNAHMPSKLGAAKEVYNRTLGPVGGKDEGPKGPTGPIINIGVKIGGVPDAIDAKVVTVHLPTSDGSSE